MRNEFENGASSGADSPMLIDQYLPEYDATEGRHVIANADPETTYEAMLTADLMNTGPIVRALGRLRDVPRVASHWLGGTPWASSSKRLRFVDVPETEEWTPVRVRSSVEGRRAVSAGVAPGCEEPFGR